MKILLDTQVLIWSIMRTRDLPPKLRQMLEEPGNEKLSSAGSIWEVAIKRALGRSDFDVDPLELAATARLDYAELAVTSEVAARVATLPHHHRDPFDRLLVVQAIEANALLVTVDRQLASYGSNVRLFA
ncbi:type II toxin-antitoxin system VapC family toxin [uncultured Enterovirga sp.]|uniref:type II toxin-antitoxin system VapC family toxin n=1 Tax=uncultured Enterovirga sp. TaxID=2026352 RepID=UPI0035CBD27B